MLDGTLRPVRRLLAAAPAAVAGLCLLAAPAGAQDPPRKRSLANSPHLWATVNVCDTRRHPDVIGIRASMPGRGRRGESLWMRFVVQYRDGAGKWRYFRKASKSTDSGFVKVGSSRYKARQSGYSFRFRPDDDDRYVLRGRVTFHWRRAGRVMRRLAEYTEGGHRAMDWSDPKGYSAARCVIED